MKKVSLVIGIMIILLLAGNAHAIVVTDGLVSWWRLDETEGTTAEDSQGAYDGTLYNFPSPPTWTTDTAGIGSFGSLDFDGADDYVLFSSSVIPLGAKTVEFWIKTTAHTSGVGKILNNMNGSISHGLCIQIQNDAFQVLSGQGVSGDFRYGLIDSDTSINDGNWHHVLYTWDGTTNTNAVKLYYDGVFEIETTADSIETTAPTFDLVFGEYADLDDTHDWLFDGLLDEIRVYNRALSPEEILQNYQAMDEEGVIPEPLTFMLLGVGLSGLLTFRWRN